MMLKCLSNLRGVICNLFSMVIGKREHTVQTLDFDMLFEQAINTCDLYGMDCSITACAVKC